MEYDRVVVRQPVHGVPVNVVRVGDTLIDTGHMEPPSRPAIERELDGGRLDGIKRIIITHPHSDHIGGSESIEPLATLPHIVYEGTPAIITDFNAYLGQVREEFAARTAGIDGADAMPAGYFVDGDYFESSIAIERVVTDGETVRIGPYEADVVYTPGHSEHHMALYHRRSGTLISGDLMTRHGFAYGPLSADLGAYERSLDRIRALEPTVLLPGHGPPIDDPLEQIDSALARINQTKATVLESVRSHGTLYAREVVEKVYEDDPRDRVFLTLVASEYLLQLAEETDITVEETNGGIVAKTSG